MRALLSGTSDNNQFHQPLFRIKVVGEGVELPCPLQGGVPHPDRENPPGVVGRPAGNGGKLSAGQLCRKARRVRLWVLRCVLVPSVVVLRHLAWSLGAHLERCDRRAGQLFKIAVWRTPSGAWALPAEGLPLDMSRRKQSNPKPLKGKGCHHCNIIKLPTRDT